MASVFQHHMYVMVQVTSVTQAEALTVLMAQMNVSMVVVMQMDALPAVPMVNLTVAMDLVSMVHGHVTVMVTVLMAQMKLIVLLHHVKTKV